MKVRTKSNKLYTFKPIYMVVGSGGSGIGPDSSESVLKSKDPPPTARIVGSSGRRFGSGRFGQVG